MCFFKRDDHPSSESDEFVISGTESESDDDDSSDISSSSFDISGYECTGEEKTEPNQDPQASTSSASGIVNREEPDRTLPLSDDEEDEDEEVETEEEDDLIKSFRQRKEYIRNHPPDIICDDFISDLSFHPNASILAVAAMTGDVHMYNYTNDSVELKETIELHTKACRDIEFSFDGNILYSSSKDKSIMLTDTQTGKLKGIYEKAHDAPIYSLAMIDENIIASGDDDGRVKLWDIRKKDAIMDLKEMEEYVSQMVTTQSKRYLVCASGDGVLTTLNLSSKSLYIQSEPYEEEMNCLSLLRRESKLLAATSKGKMLVFNWGEFAYHCDEFPGPKVAINKMIPITENVVVTGGEDGILRANHFFPQRHMGVVGQHEYAIETLDISHDGEFIASSSHDHKIKFWNIKFFEDIQVNDRLKANKRKAISHNLPSSKIRNTGDFFSELQ